MPDEHAIRAYRNERDRHRNASMKALAQIAESSARLLKQGEQGTGPDTSGLRMILMLAADAYARTEAFDAADQLSFLITEPEG